MGRDVLMQEAAIFAVSPLGLLLLDSTWRISRANRVAEQIFALDEPGLCGLALQALMTSELEWLELSAQLAGLAQTQRPVCCELECTTGDGRTLWVQFNIALLSPERPQEGAILACMDISERKFAEFELLLARDQAAEASRAKAMFLTTMSHEIRTPMNGVLGMLELLALTALDPKQGDLVITMQESANALLRLIDDILDFARIESGQLEVLVAPVQVRPLLEQLRVQHLPWARRKGLNFDVRLDPALAQTLMLDAVRLGQVLRNLVSNALKFTHNGSITLSARVLAQNGIEQTLCFEVTDTGIGIAPEHFSRLFEPFMQGESDTARRFGGAGLGLAICRRLSGMMGGHLELESEPGKGTHVSLLLVAASVPAQAEPSAQPASVVPSVTARDPGRPILFAEDNATNRKLTCMQLEKLGYSVDVAEDGARAYEKWRVGKYCLVLTDCHMPVIDGYQLVRLVRADEAGHPDAGRIPIIACTANSGQEERDKTRLVGMDDFLTKPLSITTLSATLNRWLNSVETPAVDVPASAALAEPALDGASAASPVDRSLLEVYSNGDWSVELGILHDFQQGNAEDVAALHQALANQDAAQVAWFAHRIKGASRMVGARALGDQAEALERAGKTGLFESVQVRMPDFEQCLQCFERWLEAQNGDAPNAG